MGPDSVWQWSFSSWLTWWAHHLARFARKERRHLRWVRVGTPKTGSRDGPSTQSLSSRSTRLPSRSLSREDDRSQGARAHQALSSSSVRAHLRQSEKAYGCRAGGSHILSRFLATPVRRSRHVSCSLDCVAEEAAPRVVARGSYQRTGAGR